MLAGPICREGGAGLCSQLPADTSQGAAAEAVSARMDLVTSTVICPTPVTACTPHSLINSRYIVLQGPKAAAQLLMSGTALVCNSIEYSMCTSFEHMSYFPFLCPHSWRILTGTESQHLKQQKVHSCSKCFALLSPHTLPDHLIPLLLCNKENKDNVKEMRCDK